MFKDKVKVTVVALVMVLLMVLSITTDLFVGLADVFRAKAEEATPTLHDRQCVDIVKFLYAERSMFLYDTGTGKTLIAAAIMKMLKHANPGMFSVMIVLKDQLLQTPDKLKRYADLRVLTTYADSTYVGKNFINQNLTDYDVVMITEECLLNKKVMDYLYSYRDKMISVIIDEAHKLNNFNSARSASMLRALLSKVRYTCALTATPIVTSSFQLSRLAHLLRPERYPNPKRLAQDLESKRFSIEQDPFFFINRKASEFGRTSTPILFVYRDPENVIPIKLIEMACRQRSGQISNIIR